MSVWNCIDTFFGLCYFDGTLCRRGNDTFKVCVCVTACCKKGPWAEEQTLVLVSPVSTALLCIAVVILFYHFQFDLIDSLVVSVPPLCLWPWTETVFHISQYTFLRWRISQDPDYGLQCQKSLKSNCFFLSVAVCSSYVFWSTESYTIFTEGDRYNIVMNVLLQNITLNIFFFKRKY